MQTLASQVEGEFKQSIGPESWRIFEEGTEAERTELQPKILARVSLRVARRKSRERAEEAKSTGARKGGESCAD